VGTYKVAGDFFDMGRREAIQFLQDGWRTVFDELSGKPMTRVLMLLMP